MVLGGKQIEFKTWAAKYPFVVGISTSLDTHSIVAVGSGTGVLVGRHILTAAHVVKTTNPKKVQIQIPIKTKYCCWLRTSTVSPVSIAKHPENNGKTYANDLCVLTLDEAPDIDTDVEVVLRENCDDITGLKMQLVANGARDTIFPIPSGRPCINTLRPAIATNQPAIATTQPASSDELPGSVALRSAAMVDKYGLLFPFYSDAQDVREPLDDRCGHQLSGTHGDSGGGEFYWADAEKKKAVLVGTMFGGNPERTINWLLKFATHREWLDEVTEGELPWETCDSGVLDDTDEYEIPLYRKRFVQYFLEFVGVVLVMLILWALLRWRHFNIFKHDPMTSALSREANTSAVFFFWICAIVGAMVCSAMFRGKANMGQNSTELRLL